MNPLLTDSRRQALRSASHWYAVLSGERVSPQQEARWQRRQAHRQAGCAGFQPAARPTGYPDPVHTTVASALPVVG